MVHRRPPSVDTAADWLALSHERAGDRAILGEHYGTKVLPLIGAPGNLVRLRGHYSLFDPWPKWKFEELLHETTSLVSLPMLVPDLSQHLVHAPYSPVQALKWSADSRYDGNPILAVTRLAKGKDFHSSHQARLQRLGEASVATPHPGLAMLRDLIAAKDAIYIDFFAQCRTLIEHKHPVDLRGPNSFARWGRFVGKGYGHAALRGLTQIDNGIPITRYIPSDFALQAKHASVEDFLTGINHGLGFKSVKDPVVEEAWFKFRHKILRCAKEAGYPITAEQANVMMHSAAYMPALPPGEGVDIHAPQSAQHLRRLLAEQAAAQAACGMPR